MSSLAPLTPISGSSTPNPEGLSLQTSSLTFVVSNRHPVQLFSRPHTPSPGGYTDAVANRSQFPLSGGFFSVKTGHPDWTGGTSICALPTNVLTHTQAAVLISTAQNPRSFDNFSVNGEQQLALPYAKEKDAGTFCIPLDLAAANITGVEDGANVTIQIIFAGGDGNLYQVS